MFDDFSPVRRERLPDNLATRIGALIRAGDFRVGERLPPITQMARAFRVGAPTVRQALAKLEMLQVVEIRHGVGVYVRTCPPAIQRILIEHAAMTGD